MLNLSSIYFGQKHKDFDYRDFDIIKKISRLARKHHRQCENVCNGEGYINGKFYRLDNKDAYISEDTSVFDLAIDKLEEKIIAITDKTALRVEFQHDPRGNTVKLYYGSDYIEL